MSNNRLNNNEYKSLNETVQRMNEQEDGGASPSELFQAIQDYTTSMADLAGKPGALVPPVTPDPVYTNKILQRFLSDCMVDNPWYACMAKWDNLGMYDPVGIDHTDGTPWH